MLSNAFTRFSLELINQFSRIEYRRYKRALSNVEATQRAKLADLLRLAENTHFGKKHALDASLSWESLNRKLPITEYNDWSALVQKQKEEGGLVISGEVCKRYQPTSGSTSKIKWIPYTDSFLAEIDCAVSPLIVNSFIKDSRVLNGSQYWSLSWIPTDFRNNTNANINDDMKLLPWWKRIFATAITAVPNRVSFAATSDGSMLATLAYLVSNRNLVLVSVWSPTFALSMFDLIRRYRDDLYEILSTGYWGKWQEELSFIRCPKSLRAASILKEWDGKISSDFLKSIWPKMAMVSAWDTSTSEIWAKKLKNLFPDATFVGKGLWATEGVVTIPFEGKYPLTVTSHFYEFVDLDTGVIHPSWNLKKGQVVKPLLTTASGFFRYALNDRLRVVDFIDACPCFLFLGRINDVDMVGEKTSPDLATTILNRISDQFTTHAVSLIAVTRSSSEDKKPYYLLLCEGKEDINNDEIAKATERLLQESFHYKLAREQNALDHAKAIHHSNAMTLYQRVAECRGMVLGNIKVEPLILWNGDELENVIRDSESQKRLM